MEHAVQHPVADLLGFVADRGAYRQTLPLGRTGDRQPSPRLQDRVTQLAGPGLDIAQHHEVGVLIGEAVHKARDTRVPAPMPKTAVGVVQESVGVTIAVAEGLSWSEHLLGEPTHQRAVGDSVKEQIKVGHRAERAAVGTADHRHRVDVRPAYSPRERGVEVANGHVGVGFVEPEEPAGAHARAVEDLLLDQIDVGPSRDALEDDPQQDVARVGVLPGLTWRPIGRQVPRRAAGNPKAAAFGSWAAPATRRSSPLGRTEPFRPPRHSRRSRTCARAGGQG